MSQFLPGPTHSILTTMAWGGVKSASSIKRKWIRIPLAIPAGVALSGAFALGTIAIIIDRIAKPIMITHSKQFTRKQKITAWVTLLPKLVATAAFIPVYIAVVGILTISLPIYIATGKGKAKADKVLNPRNQSG